MKRIMIVEDETAIREFEAINLKRAGYTVVEAGSGEEALEIYDSDSEGFDIALLDISMPGMDGFALCKELRRRSASLGIIMLTARAQEMDKVSGLMLGADDYITKPFGTNELLARIRTAIRHNNKLVGEGANTIRPYSAAGLVIDFEKRLVILEGKEIHLTRVEYKIVSLLAKNSGKVMTYDTLIDQVWGPYADDNNRILRVNMANIRRKIESNPGEPKYIFTELGVGYRMLEDEGMVGGY